MLLMWHSHNDFSVLQVELWERQESDVTDILLSDPPSHGTQLLTVRTRLGQRGQGSELGFMAFLPY